MPSSGDTPWVSCSVGLSGYVFFLRNDGRVDRSSDDADTSTNFQTVHTPGGALAGVVGYMAISAYVWIVEYHTILVPVIIMLIILYVSKKLMKNRCQNKTV